jgi:voltage-gated potassium channel
MYYAENEAQPEAFTSIPAAMWWGVVTLTTVGYGDVYPVTPLGKLFGAALAFIGIGLFALPAGIIASGFSEEIQKRKQNDIPPQAETQPAAPKPEQQQEIAGHIEQSAELMKLCVETAKRKLGDSFDNEEIIRDLAVALYREAVGKFNL